MENPVYVSGDEFGNVISVSKNNRDFGWITLVQDNVLIQDGWANNKKLTSIIMGKLEVLDKLNYVAGEILPGKIIVIESLTPFSSEDYDVKLSGPNGIPCTFEGKRIYRKTFYTDNLESKSIFVKHDNKEEIKAFNAGTLNKKVEPVNKASREMFEV